MIFASKLIQGVCFDEQEQGKRPVQQAAPVHVRLLPSPGFPVVQVHKDQFVLRIHSAPPMPSWADLTIFFMKAKHPRRATAAFLPCGTQRPHFPVVLLASFVVEWKKTFHHIGGG